MVILVRGEGYHKRIFFSVWASVLTCALFGVLVITNCFTVFYSAGTRLLDDILYRTLSSGRGLRRGCLPMSKCGVDLAFSDSQSPWGLGFCGRGLHCILTVEFHPGEPPNKTAAFICESTFFDVASRLCFTVHRDVALLFC